MTTGSTVSTARRTPAFTSRGLLPLAALLMGFLILPIPAQTAGKEKVGLPGLVAQLGGDDPQERLAAQRLLCELGVDSLPLLVPLLKERLPREKDENWRIIYQTIEQISQASKDWKALDQPYATAVAPEARKAVFAGIDFVWIPPGWFLAGTSLPPEDKLLDSDKFRGAPRRVHLDGYWISRREITVANLRALGLADIIPRNLDNLLPPALLRDGEETPIPSFGAPEGIDRVLGAITELVRKDGLLATIPTDDQWEKAARGTDARLYVWGNSRNIFRNSPGREGGTVPPVYPKPSDVSPYGVCDMTWSLAERTRSNDTGFSPKDGFAQLHAKGLTGRHGWGSRIDCPGEAMPAYRTEGAPIGLRVVLIPTDAKRPPAEAGPSEPK